MAKDKVAPIPAVRKISTRPEVQPFLGADVGPITSDWAMGAFVEL
jgi:hypothetical protein